MVLPAIIPFLPISEEGTRTEFAKVVLFKSGQKLPFAKIRIIMYIKMLIFADSLFVEV